MKLRCSIYFVEPRAFVVPTHVTVHGIGIDSEPIGVVEDWRNTESLGAAIHAALLYSKTEIKQPDSKEWSAWRRRFLKALGVKSDRALAGVSRVVDVWTDEDRMFVQGNRPASDGRGFEPRPETLKRVEHADIGAAVAAMMD